MGRIRLNQEFRNKIGTRMRVHIEAEPTQEKQAYDDLKLINLRSMTMLGTWRNKLLENITRQKILLKQNIFKTSLRMLTLFNQIVVSIFITWEKKKNETTTTMSKLFQLLLKNISIFVWMVVLMLIITQVIVPIVNMDMLYCVMN